jgi:hypothetical protein
MLRIDVSSADITQAIFEQYNLPTPPNGTETEVNGDVILLFEDEEEAVAYLDELEDYASEIEGSSPEKALVNTLATAINSDEFVQTYLQQ